ncbi:MAG TPA: TonB-dependent receptor [Chthoniobacterales bacterium]
MFLHIAPALISAFALSAADADTIEASAVASRVVVIGTTPVEGSEIDPDKIPAGSYAIDAAALGHDVSSTMPDALLQRVPSVQINDVTGNPFQPDVQYRGFTASPVLGTPQGLAVYENGVRTNEAFGDTVNWDLIPEFAIDGLEIVSNNPAFGLNALGGALAVKMKNGFTFHDFGIELHGGAFGRLGAMAETGIERGNIGLYLGADALHDDGWRDRSASDLRRVYADVGIKGSLGEFHLAFTGASNDFGAVGPTPIELLERRWESVFTTPQTTRNELAFLTGTFSSHLTETTSLEGALYYRGFHQWHVDGNTTDEVAPGLPDDAVPGEIDRTRTTADSFGGAVQLTSTATFFGRDNHFVAGGSLDHGRVNFGATSKLGTIGPDLFVTGTGVFLDGASGDAGPVQLRTTNTYAGLYVTDTLDLTAQLSATAGARYNIAEIRLKDLIGTSLDGSHEFTRFNPVIGATYKLFPNLTLYAGYSEANRAPTAAELGCADPDSPCLLDNFLVADPSLNQVVSRTIETGLRGRFGPSRDGAALSWNLGLFRTDNSDDIINVASSTPNRGYFVNAGDTRRQGMEAHVEYHDARWFVHAEYSFLDATFQSRLAISSPFNPAADADGVVRVTPGDQLASTPRHRFKAGVDYAFTGKWKAGADLVAVSSQYLEGDVSNRNPEIPAYYIVNLHTSYEVTRNCELFGRIQNLFDRHYYTSGTFFDARSVASLHLSDPRTLSPAQPLAVYAGVRIKW